MNNNEEPKTLYDVIDILMKKRDHQSNISYDYDIDVDDQILNQDIFHRKIISMNAQLISDVYGECIALLNKVIPITEINKTVINEKVIHEIDRLINKERQSYNYSISYEYDEKAEYHMTRIDAFKECAEIIQKGKEKIYE